MTFLVNSYILENEIGGGSQPFAYTGGTQDFEVPTGVTTLTVDSYGAQGGTGIWTGVAGGLGGRVQCDLTVTPGEILRIYVGGVGGDGRDDAVAAVGGFNGGGNGPAQGGGAGGGASDIRRTPYALADRLVIAGGGGGVGASNSFNGAGAGGVGGTPAGTAGADDPGDTGGGGGGTASAGGTAGGGVAPGGVGALGQGGVGGNSATRRGGGSGGGGYYGGGGGGSKGGTGFHGGGGGGGSGLSTGVNEILESGVRTGNGQAILTW